jgi:2'-5' RNA ligase
MTEAFNQDLLSKYQKMNEDFQDSADIDFPDKQALEVMRKNFNRIDGEFITEEGRILTAACDVWPLFIIPESTELKDFFYDKAQEILSLLKQENKKIYWASKDAYHISIALFQDLRPCDMNDEKLLNTRLSAEQVKEITEMIKLIVNNYKKFKIKLYGLSLSLSGSLTAIFVDNGEYFELQKRIGDELNSISYIPERKYKKDIIHITLARILEPINQDMHKSLKNIIKNYYNLLDSNIAIEVNKIYLAHEIKWMHEVIDQKSIVEIKLKE